MTDVFLSYSRTDFEAAEIVQQALSAHGIKVFWDQETPAGQDWDTWIRSRLAEARIAVVLWSHTSVKSPNVRHEALLARDAGIMLPVMIDDMSPTEFPLGLYLVQALKVTDWRNPKSRNFDALVRLVSKRLSAENGGEAPAARPARSSKKRGVPTFLLVLCLLCLASITAGTAWLLRGAKQGDPAFLSSAMVGNWRWGADHACGSGPAISLDGGNLVITTANSRFVHLIEQDMMGETRTRVVEPSFALGQQWVFSAEAPGSMMLVEDRQLGKVATWLRCD